MGGLSIRQGKSNEDLNTIFDPQIVSWAGSAIKNLPHDVQYKNYGTLINLPDGMTHNEADGVQLFADPDSTLWLRAYSNGSLDWTPWKKILTTDDLKK